MAKDDYTSTGGGLKLKGAKNAGISKHKKKKKAKPAAETSADITGVSERSGSRGAAERPMDEDRVEEVGDEEERGKSSADVKERSRSRSPDASMGPAAASGGVGKTDAERRHEEMRRKRLSERLAREGTKTHKERVEELNKYLSTLSEHHDMPRIGPG